MVIQPMIMQPIMSRPTVSGLTLLRNGIICGYPFVEAIRCLVDLCDEVIICEGHSDDSTMVCLEHLKTIYPKITIYHDEWYTSGHGYEFGRITNLGVSRCNGDYVFCLQADEVIHEDTYQYLRQAIYSNRYNSIMFSYKHFRWGLDKVVEGVCYPWAVRIIRNRVGITSHQDAWTFEGNVSPHLSYTAPGNSYMYHMGYVFYYNIIMKMLNHFQYYTDLPDYKSRHDAALAVLQSIKAGKAITSDELHEVFETGVPLVPCNCDLPKLMQPHVGAIRYNPTINLPTLPPLPELAANPANIICRSLTGACI